QLRNKCGAQNFGIGIDVVDGASIDADGRKQSRILAGTRQVGADVATIEKDGAARVSPLNAAVEIVPLAGPADGGGRILHFIQSGDIFLLPKQPEKRKRSIKRAAIVLPDD